MKGFWTVFSYHFNELIRAKGTIITLAITVLLVGGVGAYSHFGDSGKEASKDNIVIVNDTQKYAVKIDDLNAVIPTVKAEEGKMTDLADLKKKLEGKKIDGLFVIGEEQGVPTSTYMYSGFPSSSASFGVESYLQQVYISKTIVDNKLSPEDAKKLLAKVQTKTEVVSATGKDTMQTYGIVYIFVFLMYMFIIMFGQHIATNIAAEKSSRVMEIMITKVKPITMMYAKIASNLAMGITQLVVMFGSFMLLKEIGWINIDGVVGQFIDFDSLTPRIGMFFFLYFIAGYLVYAMLYAAVGSLVSRTEDIQTAAMPVVILVIGAFFLGMGTLTNPTNMGAEIGTYIPFFSPIVTFARIVLGVASNTEIGITLATLVVTIIVLNIFTSRVYKNGVLNYSNDKFSWKSIKNFVSKS